MQMLRREQKTSLWLKRIAASTLRTKNQSKIINLCKLNARQYFTHFFVVSVTLMFAHRTSNMD